MGSRHPWDWLKPKLSELHIMNMEFDQLAHLPNPRNKWHHAPHTMQLVEGWVSSTLVPRKQVDFTTTTYNIWGPQASWQLMTLSRSDSLGSLPNSKMLLEFEKDPSKRHQPNKVNSNSLCKYDQVKIKKKCFACAWLDLFPNVTSLTKMREIHLINRENESRYVLLFS